MKNQQALQQLAILQRLANLEAAFAEVRQVCQAHARKSREEKLRYRRELFADLTGQWLQDPR